MAIDTANKRYSCLLLALPFGRVLPVPDGGFTTQGDRQQLLRLYAGVLTAIITTYLAVTFRTLTGVGQ